MEINQAADKPSKSRMITIWGLRLGLGVIFIIVAVSKLTGTGNTVQYFAAIGWGQWFRYLTGSLDLLGVILLFLPRWTCYGAIILACSVGSAAVISLTVLRGNPVWGGPVMIVVPLVFTLVAMFLAWLAYPLGCLKRSA
jgi:uncharacterized membrane protein YphA (DoxX/SURF4 family)